MNIDIVTEKLPPAFHWTPDASWRGTEEFYVQTATELAKLGHSVQVFYDGPRRTHNGVRYVPRSLFASLWQSDACLLACNDHPDPDRSIPYRRRVRWSNFAHEAFVDLPFRFAYNAHIVLSDYHRRQFMRALIDPGPVDIFTIGHGYDPTLYSFRQDKDQTILFTSSPDRGQDFLQSIAPEVYMETGYRFNFNYRGIPEAEMAKKYASADIWVHPGQGTELFCISALKAQVSGCIPVVVPNQALAETVKRGVFVAERSNFARDLVEIIKNRSECNKIRTELGQIRFKTWADVTKEVENVLF